MARRSRWVLLLSTVVCLRVEAAAPDFSELEIPSPNDPTAFDLFGGAIASDGWRLVVGAEQARPNEGRRSGAVYVYDLGAPEPQLEVALDREDVRFLGREVAVSGDTVAATAYLDLLGVVVVFAREAAGWGEQQLVQPDVLDRDFGRTLALEGDLLAVGSGDFREGRVYVYRRENGAWIQEALLSSPSAQFGQAIAFQEDRLAVGDSQVIHFYERQDGAWLPLDRWIEIPDLEGSRDFGSAIDWQGQILIVGAPDESHLSEDCEPYCPGPDAGAAYLFRDRAGEWVFEQRLRASDANRQDEFGNSVALGGTFAVVGAWQDDAGSDDTGAVYVFRDTSDGWREELTIHADAAEEGDRFGSTVVMAGSRFFVGVPTLGPAHTPGGVFAYHLTEKPPLQQLAELTSRVADELHRSALRGVGFGRAGARNERRFTDLLEGIRTQLETGGHRACALVLRAADKSSGRCAEPEPGLGELAWVLADEIGGTERMIGCRVPRSPEEPLPPYPLRIDGVRVEPEDAQRSARVGSAVALDGKRLIVGAQHDSAAPLAPASGAAYVYDWAGEGWVQSARVFASDASDDSAFGAAVALDGDLAVVGSPRFGRSPSFRGQAYPFGRSGDGAWLEEALSVPLDLSTHDNFGFSIAMSGGFAAVASRGRDSVETYLRSESGWEPWLRVEPADDPHNPDFGYSIAATDSWLVVGAPAAPGPGPGSGGAVYVYDIRGAAPAQVAKLQAPDGMSSDLFGDAVDVEGDMIVVGAPSRADNVGCPRCGGSRAGAAYVYVLDGVEFRFRQLLLASNRRGDNLGQSVAIDGQWLVVGAPNAVRIEHHPLSRGSAYVFRRDGDRWFEEAELRPGLPLSTSAFAFRLDADGGRIVVGDPSAGLVGGFYAYTVHELTTREQFRSLISIIKDAIRSGDYTGRARARLFEIKAAVGFAERAVARGWERSACRALWRSRTRTQCRTDDWLEGPARAELADDLSWLGETLSCH